LRTETVKNFPGPKADSIRRPSGLESEALRIEQSWLHECEGIASCESHLRRKKNDVTSAEKKRREQKLAGFGGQKSAETQRAN